MLAIDSNLRQLEKIITMVNGKKNVGDRNTTLIDWRSIEDWLWCGQNPLTQTQDIIYLSRTIMVELVWDQTNGKPQEMRGMGDRLLWELGRFLFFFIAEKILITFLRGGKCVCFSVSAFF